MRTRKDRSLLLLLIDHIGGLDSAFRTLFAGSTLIVPKSRTPEDAGIAIAAHRINLLPASPTFLNLMLLAQVPSKFTCDSVEIIAYGAEAMPAPLLVRLAEAFPHAQLQQKFGTSETGAIRITSTDSRSLFFKIEDHDTQWKIVNQTLWLKTPSRILGYLNAETPIDSEGWYNTGDKVEQDGEWIKFLGRASDVINVGGLKFMASDVERKALDYPNVSLVKVTPKQNPITGQHVELLVEPTNKALFDKDIMIDYLKSNLPPHMVPKRVRIGKIGVGHRFKKT